MSEDLSLTERLAHHLMTPIGDADRRRARLHLLDWLGCVLGARQSEVGRFEFDNVQEKAAWLGNILEMDDVHRKAILHPGPVIWPTILNSESTDIHRCLDAALRGYEAMITIGETFDARHYAYHHNTATAGTFGSSVALGNLASFSEKQIMSALGLAGSGTSGLWQMRHEKGHTKQWHIWNCVHTASSICRAVDRGAAGSRFILEGPQGLYAATCDDPGPMALTDHWRIHEVSFKPWGACRHAHPAIDAALELKAAEGGGADLKGDIRVETFADAITFCDRPDPKTPQEAKFSLQHAVAIVAERGVPQLADFEPDAIAALAKARSRITVAEASDITARYPAHFGARVSTAAGTQDLLDTRGDPERPLSDEGIEGKARALMAWGGLSDAEADEAVAAALTATVSGAVIDVLERHL